MKGAARAATQAVALVQERKDEYSSNDMAVAFQNLAQVGCASRTTVQMCNSFLCVGR